MLRLTRKSLQLTGILIVVFSGLASCRLNQTQDPLSRQVTIYRDNYGVPHIVGESEEATFFGYGYAQAQDHLEQMMLQYRDAQGRRTEVLGFEALGDGYLRFVPYEYRWDGDYLQRLLRTRQGVEENREKMNPGVYGILSAFAKGVNACIAEQRGRIPDWIDPITPEDVEALERSQYFRFYSINDALSKLEGGAFSFPDLGSNQFAISREKSASGRVIHVEHTHMPWANRFQNYEAHLITPGKLNAGGISWFGSPFFLDGFNDKITWSATYNTPNIADIYEEKLNPENHLQYSYDGQWKDIRADQATFKVKGPRGFDTVTLPLYYTHHGPIVKFDKARSRAFSVKLPNFDGVNYSTNLYLLMKAQNLEQFKAALGQHLMPKWNMLYSDAENIYWVHNGTVARRADGYNWHKPVPGWTKETEWGPFLPLDVYPQVLNPASGFLQNCNNPPWVVTPNSGLKPLQPAAYYLQHLPDAAAGLEALNSRGERLFQVLGQNRRFTMDDMKGLGMDTFVVPADVIVPLIAGAYGTGAKEGADARMGRAIELIKAWDHRSGKDSAAYTIIHFWGAAYSDLFSARKFGRLTSQERKTIDIHSPDEQKMALAALKEALDRIQKHFGKTEVPWGEVNVVVRGGKFPMDGDEMYDPLHPDHGVEQDNGQIYCNDGWGHLMVVMEGNPKEVWSLLPYGQSEDPRSPHYNDQAQLHSRGEIKRFWLTPEEILSHSESVSGDRERINLAK